MVNLESVSDKKRENTRLIQQLVDQGMEDCLRPLKVFLLIKRRFSLQLQLVCKERVMGKK